MTGQGPRHGPVSKKEARGTICRGGQRKGAPVKKSITSPNKKAKKNIRDRNAAGAEGTAEKVVKRRGKRRGAIWQMCWGKEVTSSMGEGDGHNGAGALKKEGSAARGAPVSFIGKEPGRP